MSAACGYISLAPATPVIFRQDADTHVFLAG